MLHHKIKISLFTLWMLVPAAHMAAGNWPKEIRSDRATIVVYQPQPDSLRGDHLFARAAVSVTTPRSKDPVFGAIWTDARFSTDRQTGACAISEIKVRNVRFPGIDTIDPAKVERFKMLIEEESASWNLSFSMEELKATLAMSDAAITTSANMKNDPPEILFVRKPSILLIFDGDPVAREVENAGVKRIINTPFLVLQDEQDKQYYLYGNTLWYKSPDPVKSPWVKISTPSQAVSRYVASLQQQMQQSGTLPDPSSAKQQSNGNQSVPDVIVRTKPAELLQTEGDPKFAPIQGTQLLYVTNTGNDIFMTIDDNQYYILLSGRWYRSGAMTGPWRYVESGKLPGDFSRIPEGSEKDAVLASVPGTQAAKEAVMDAQIPQTATVNRATAHCTVKWDGDPKFEKISGTELARGLNTSSTVLLYRNTYYVCDNAVWFTGTRPEGPWEVAISVPDEVSKIPPDNPAYNVKYVYIYDVQPDVIYVGYTPGYMGCYVYGPTVVYGTGYIYPAFYGPYYYPRPVTFGFSMHYNPWYGWSMGFSMSVGFFTFSIRGPAGYPGGWWGPPVYRPPYRPPYSHYYGPRAPVYRGGGNTINIDNSRNIYVNRGDGSSRPVTAARTTGQQNNVYTDRNGNVYRNQNGNWQQNQGGNWQNRSQGGGFNADEMNRQSQARDRGTQGAQNRSSVQSGPAGRSPGMGTGGARGGAPGGRRK